MWARKRQRIESHKQDRKGDSESGKDIKKEFKIGGGGDRKDRKTKHRKDIRERGKRNNGGG